MAVAEEQFVGRGTEVRTFLYFKVSTPALQKFVPEGFEILPASAGPAAGANLLAAFVDQITSLDAADKPLDLLRYVLFEIPVKPAGNYKALVLFTGYRVEQAVDVVQPASERSRLEKITLQAKSEKLSPLFDGTEELVSIVSVPVYARRIVLPAP